MSTSRRRLRVSEELLHAHAPRALRLAIAAERVAASSRKTPPAGTATSSPRTSSPTRSIGLELTLDSGDPVFQGDAGAALPVEGIREGLHDLGLADRHDDETTILARAHDEQDDDAVADRLRRAGVRELVAEVAALRRTRHSPEEVARAEAPTPPAGTSLVGLGTSKRPPGDEDLRRALLEAIAREAKAREELERRVAALEEDLAARRTRVERERRRRRAAKESTER